MLLPKAVLHIPPPPRNRGFGELGAQFTQVGMFSLLSLEFLQAIRHTMFFPYTLSVSQNALAPNYYSIKIVFLYH